MKIGQFLYFNHLNIIKMDKTIKTFDDAYNKLGDKNQLVKQYKLMRVFENKPEAKSILAYLKLQIIATALNEGWKPTENNPGVFAVVYFKYPGAWDFRLHSNRFDSYWNYSVNSGKMTSLIVKNLDAAEYFARQFFKLWKDYIKP